MFSDGFFFAFSGPTFESVFCRPIARPSKTEWSEREMKSMKERKGEWAWKSTWTWWPLLSRSLLAPCPCPCPCPFLFSCNRGALSSWTPPPPWQVRTIFSSMRTVKKPAAMMNSGRGKLVCFRPRHKRNTFYVQFVVSKTTDQSKSRDHSWHWQNMSKHWRTSTFRAASSVLMSDR